MFTQLTNVRLDCLHVTMQKLSSTHSCMAQEQLDKRIVNGSSKDGQKLINTFLTNMPALKVLRNKVSKLATRGYVIGIEGVSYRYVQNMRHNTLLQGAGAIICKNGKVHHLTGNEGNLDYRLVASIHDEYQFEVRKDQAEEFGGHKKAMKLTEKSLHVRCLRQ